MDKKNAKAILPDDLLEELQKYIQGEYLYVPKADGSRKKWGEKSGTRRELSERNAKIRLAFNQGTTIEELAETFYLAENSIKKIVYARAEGL